MHRLAQLRNRSRWFAVAIVAAALSGPSFAATESAPEEFRVTVYRDHVAVSEMRFADSAALESWIRSRQTQVPAAGDRPRDSGALAKPFLPDAAYLETDAAGRSILP
jgi:hypothetical protein